MTSGLILVLWSWESYIICPGRRMTRKLRTFVFNTHLHSVSDSPTETLSAVSLEANKQISRIVLMYIFVIFIYARLEFVTPIGFQFL